MARLRREPPEPRDDETVVVPADETVADPGWQAGPEGTHMRVDEEVEVVEEQEVVPPRRPRPTLWPWLLALLLVVLGGLAAALLLSRDDGESRPGTTSTAAGTEVPLVVGVREEEARSRLREAGLEPEARQRAGNQPAGIVLAQDPKAGTEIEAGGVVQIVVSTGPPTDDVPDVVGEEAAAAIATLEEAGFGTRTTEVFDPQPDGEVVGQQPAAGQQLGDDGVVTLTVSKGPEPQPVAVPDVVGSQGSEAAAALRDAGLRSNLVTVPSSQPSGAVVAQSPAAGTEVEEGSSVRLNVSAGGTPPAQTTQPTETQPPPPDSSPAVVPDAVGGPLADAARAFGDEGLKVSVQPVPSDEQAGTVVAQARPAGTELERGKTVQVNVSIGPEPAQATSVPDVVRVRQDDARRRIARAGFEVLSIEQRGNPSQVGVVLSQTPGGNASIPRGSLVILYVGAAG